MKKTIILLVSVFTAVLASCTGNRITNAENVEYLRIDFQHGYNKSITILYVDNQNVFEDTLTTRDVLSLARQEQIIITKGVHKIRCVIENSSADTTFNVPDSLVIGIYKDYQTSKVGFRIYHENNFPMYD
jgi:hypothetical protein